MKRLFITLTAIAGFAFAANAQTFGFGQGDVIVEGNIGFSSENDKNTEVKENSFSFNPKVGYFLTDKFALGIEAALMSGKEEGYTTGADWADKANAFGIGVFGRYYFLELGSRFKTYAEAGVGYVSSKYEEEVGGTTTVGPNKASGFGINAGVGANYFLTEKIALNLSLTDVIGYSSAKPDGGKATNNFYLNAGGVDNPFAAVAFGLTFKF